VQHPADPSGHEPPRPEGDHPVDRRAHERDDRDDPVAARRGRPHHRRRLPHAALLRGPSPFYPPRRGKRSDRRGLTGPFGPGSECRDQESASEASQDRHATHGPENAHEDRAVGKLEDPTRDLSSDVHPYSDPNGERDRRREARGPNHRSPVAACHARVGIDVTSARRSLPPSGGPRPNRMVQPRGGAVSRYRVTSRTPNAVAPMFWYAGWYLRVLAVV